MFEYVTSVVRTAGLAGCSGIITTPGIVRESSSPKEDTPSIIAGGTDFDIVDLSVSVALVLSKEGTSLLVDVFKVSKAVVVLVAPLFVVALGECRPVFEGKSRTSMSGKEAALPLLLSDSLRDGGFDVSFAREPEREGTEVVATWETVVA